MLRFMIQDLIGNAVPAFKETTSWTNNLIGSALSVALWGYFSMRRDRPIRRNLDAVAAVRHRQPDARRNRADGMHGRAVQDETRAIRAGNVRLRLGSSYARLLPGLEKVFSPDPNVGFLSHAFKYW